MTAETANTNRSGYISRDVAARLLDLSTKRIDQLVADGWIPKTARGQYPLVGVVQGYIRFLKDEARRASKSAAASRKDDARTRLLEMKVAEEEGRLCDLEEANHAMDTVVGFVVTELDSLPVRFTRDLNLRTKLEDEVTAMRTRLANKLRQVSEELATGEAG